MRISRRAASLSPSIVAAKRRMPTASAASASAVASARPRPWFCHGSPTTIAISAVPRPVGQPDAARHRHELVGIVLQHRDERDVVDPVDLGQVPQLGAREARLGGEEALADALLAELTQTA